MSGGRGGAGEAAGGVGEAGFSAGLHEETRGESGGAGKQCGQVKAGRARGRGGQVAGPSGGSKVGVGWGRSGGDV